MSFDAILKNIGGCGRYQILVLLLMNVLKMYTGYETLLPVIIAYKQNHHCSAEESLTVPGNGSLVYGKCHVYRNETPHLKVRCSSWTFDQSVVRTSIRSQFGLVCDHEYRVSLSTTFFFLGFTIGCTLYGIISDRFGRIMGIMSSTAHLFIFSLAVAFSPTYWTYCILRFFAGIGNGGLMSTLFTMAVEVTDPKHRAFFSIMVQNGFSVGGILLSFSSFLLRDHFWVQITLALPMILTIFLPFLIYESPRWLFATGRLKKADKVIRAIAKMNKKKLADDFDIQTFHVNSVIGSSVEKAMDNDGAQTDLRKAFASLFKSLPLALCTLIIWYDWLVVSMGYFASYFTLGNLGGDIFSSLCINCFVEAPARVMVVFTAKWFGRVSTTSATYIAGGITCLINACMIEQVEVLGVPVRIMGALGKFFFTAAFDMIWFYSGEVFPTVIRNVGVGVGSTWARVGGTIAPQASLLFTIWRPAPLIIMGVLPIIGGIASIIMPETKDKALPETVKDGQAFVKDGWMWCCSKPPLVDVELQVPMETASVLKKREEEAEDKDNEENPDARLQPPSVDAFGLRNFIELMTHPKEGILVS